VTAKREGARPYKQLLAKDPVIRAIFLRARELDITEYRLAKISGYSRATIQYLRLGKREGSWPGIRNLAEALGLRIVVEKPGKIPYAGKET
jgi:transcriptional regulator with XRE-family HTH domain